MTIFSGLLALGMKAIIKRINAAPEIGLRLENKFHSRKKKSLPQVRGAAPAGKYGWHPKHHWLVLKVTVTSLCSSVNRAFPLWVYGLCNNFKQSEESVSTGDVGGTAAGRRGGQVEDD